MIDLRWLRENPQAFERAMAHRGLTDPQGLTAEILDHDARIREWKTRIQAARQERNQLARRIGAGKDGARERGEALKQSIRADQSDCEAREKTLGDLLASLPNVLEADVPKGRDEGDNRRLRAGGTPRREEGLADHGTLGEGLGMMDFAAAAAVSGARFVYLRDDLARLERALAAFMLDTHRCRFGYREISPPLLVRDHALFGTGQLPKFAEDLYRTTEGSWLIPTAEVPLVNTVREEILDPGALPIRWCALTPCFRSEAGAAGRDTRGMIRMHQFSKVELVSITAAEDSPVELDRTTSCAEHILKELGLAWRVLLLCSGDTGFSAAKTHDIEVWMAGEQRYREISSCSNCRDFQTRRMRCRLRGEKGTSFPHSLNGSGLAVGRTLAAILENFQQSDGSIRLPKVLHPYMDGQSTIPAKKP